MWNTLTIISILLVIGAASIRFVTTKDLEHERTALTLTSDNKKKATDHQQKIKDLITDTVAKTKETDTAAATQEGEEAKQKNEESDKTAKKGTVEGQLKVAQDKLDKLNKDLAEVGEIEDLVEKSQNLQAEMAAVQQEIAITKENYKNAVTKREATDSTIADFRDKVSRQRAGQMIEVNAKIAQTFDNWGFVVINAGGNQGINAKVKLDVKREDKIIGKLTITNLEPNVSICDVASLNAGEKIAVGDSVVLSAESKWDPNKKPIVEILPAAATPAPAPEQTTTEEPADDDPFGLGGDNKEPEEPKTEEDPFGL
jgi:DNA repair exonuclease SbcCD ATPase subunit